MKSFYHDLKTDRILTENEYHKEDCTTLINYFGEYKNRKEAQNALDTKYSYLKGRVNL